MSRITVFSTAECHSSCGPLIWLHNSVNISAAILQKKKWSEKLRWNICKNIATLFGAQKKPQLWEDTQSQKDSTQMFRREFRQRKSSCVSRGFGTLPEKRNSFSVSDCVKVILIFPIFPLRQWLCHSIRKVINPIMSIEGLCFCRAMTSSEWGFRLRYVDSLYTTFCVYWERFECLMNFRGSLQAVIGVAALQVTLRCFSLDYIRNTTNDDRGGQVFRVRRRGGKFFLVMLLAENIVAVFAAAFLCHTKYFSTLKVGPCPWSSTSVQRGFVARRNCSEELVSLRVCGSRGNSQGC